MPTITADLEFLEFDSKKYTEALKKRVMVRMRQAARAFVRAAYPHVPVETGMSRATFLYLAEALRVRVPIKPMTRKISYRATKNGYKAYIVDVDKWYRPAQGKKYKKDIALGRNLGPNIHEALIFSGKKFRFKFYSRITYFNWNEFYSTNSPTSPWESYIYGRDAFLAVMRDFNRHFPSIKGHITKTRISIGQGGRIKVTKSPLIRKQQTVRGTE